MHAMPTPIAAIFATLVLTAVAQTSALPTYYFVEDKMCTVLVDFQDQRSDIERMSGDLRLLRLITDLLSEFASNGPTKCGGADVIRMMAVYIPGVDNYGRPDFPNRVNVVRIDGGAATLESASKHDFTDINQIKSILTVTTFDQKP